jgi:hypothetical protein
MAPYLETAIQWLHDTLRCQIRARRAAAPTGDPAAWVDLCWEVGHSLSMMQAHGIPAQPVIDAVSRKLVDEFGPGGDWTPYGIRTMRQFYLDYFERPDLQPRLRAVDWDCHKILLALCRDPAQQEYYLEICRSEGLGAEALAAALKERRYERSAALPESPVKPGSKPASKHPKGFRKGMGKALGKAAELGKAATRLLPRGHASTRLSPKAE